MSRRIGKIPKIGGNFIESILPVRAFATLTTPTARSIMELESLFPIWIRGIQAPNRVTVGWVVSIEAYPQRHIQAALVSAAQLDCRHAIDLWQAMVAPRWPDAARVEPYTQGHCGLGYIMKQLGSVSVEPRLSDNLPAFSSGFTASQFEENSLQRRQTRRIKAQLAREREASA